MLLLHHSPWKLSTLANGIEIKPIHQTDTIHLQVEKISMFGTLLSIMIFVTDCDNTLVHYDSSDKSELSNALEFTQTTGGDIPDQELIIMPASSGSGKIASVSALTIKRLNEIALENVETICATGMRASTMLQREGFFPTINYWACENGGRIFHRMNQGEAPTEIVEYAELFQHNTESRNDLATFAAVLRGEGWVVDDKGYKTMIRIKGENQDSIVARIPSTLSHTFNLGYLDVQFPGLSKLSAVKWILDNRLSKSKLSELSAIDIASTLPLKEQMPRFLFMGDDDNDIEIAAASTVAFVTKPCSTAMQSFIDQYHLEKKAGIENSIVVQAIHEAPSLRHRGTEDLLARVLETIKLHQQSPPDL